MKHIKLSIFLFLGLYIPYSNAQILQSYNSSDIYVELQKLNTIGSVLYVAAHPDDENTRLLSYLAKEKKVRTAYLSLTRGDGGQNLIGSEQGDLLGLIRTQELLAARRVDGAEQFFTKANDFGYSKTPEESFKIWNKDSIMADVVWVIRNFKPDIIITRFPDNGDGGHGHHTASAILAQEAFDLAGDKNQFPEQLKYVEIWQAKRLFWNSWRPTRDKNAETDKLLKLDAGTYNVILGKSYSEIAAESRSMHKSQGFGSSKSRGAQTEYLEQLKGDKAEKDPFEGIDLSWGRISKNDSIQQLMNVILKNYNSNNPSGITPDLIKMHKMVSRTADSHYKKLKLKEIEDLLFKTSGLWAEIFCNEYELSTGKKSKFSIQAVNRGNIDVELIKAEYIPIGNEISINKKLENNILFTKDDTLSITEKVNTTNPYWLEEAHGAGLFAVKEQKLVGKPENDPAICARLWFRVGDLTLKTYRPVMYRWTDPVDGELYRSIEVSPNLTFNLDKNIIYCSENKAISMNMMLKSVMGTENATLHLSLPKGWQTRPALIETGKIAAKETKTIRFEIIPAVTNFENKIIDLEIALKAEGKVYNRSYKQINYKHIPIQTLFPKASLKLVLLNVKRKKQEIGYIPGAGDDVVPVLEQLGYNITILNEEALKTTNLAKFQTIIAGIRAYNTNDWLKNYYTKLMEFTKNGGTYIVQYNTSNWISAMDKPMGPSPFKISRNRVTEEDAVMRILEPNNPVFNIPNKITDKDFENWIQERGLYFASEYGTEFLDLLESNDTNEKPAKGSLIVNKYGKGHFVYTGLAFWRQLPAGVSGATRLFMNLIELK
jgi:LmbE family N-acetylglucosaminyl deacetylase